MILACLGIHRGDRVALVGGGGKTTLAGRLVTAACTAGWTALFTTTTKVLPPEEAFVVAGDDPALEPLRRRLVTRGKLFLLRRWLDERDDQAPSERQRKVGGFTPEVVDRLAGALQPDLLVVEADGSRHRPFKAPAAWEPQVPATTTVLAVLAGLSVIGRPLDSRQVHRPEQVAALSGIPLGAPVTPAAMAAVLAHPQGGRKGAPPQARTLAVLTQATAGRQPDGRRVARRLLAGGGFERVVLVDLDAPQAQAEVWPKPTEQPVCAVVLAAGASRRMGRNKLLLPLAGKPLVAHAVEAALGSRADEVVVVLGAQAEAVRLALGGRPVQYLDNRAWSEGLAASVRLAVRALGERCAGLLFLAGDMPLVSPAHLDRLIAAFQEGPAIVWSGDGRSRGIPALFGAATFPALRGLRGDVGGRSLAGHWPETTVLTKPQVLWDVDTSMDWKQVEQWFQEHR